MILTQKSGEEEEQKIYSKNLQKMGFPPEVEVGAKTSSPKPFVAIIATISLSHFLSNFHFLFPSLTNADMAKQWKGQ